MLLAADAGVRPMQRVLLAAVRSMRSAVSLDAVQAFLHANDIPALLRVGEGAITAGEGVRAMGLTPVVADVMGRSSRAVASRDAQLRGAARVPVASANPAAVEWARLFAATRVRETSIEQRRVLRSIIEQAIKTGLPPRESAKLIRDVVGLTQKQVQRVSNAAARMQAASAGARVSVAGKTLVAPKGGFTLKAIQRETERLANRLHAQRALTIARTETMRAANMGQQELWRDRRNRGLLTGKEQREWIVTPDDRLCPLCAPMDGARAEFDQSFSNGVMVPPLHPNCRCTVALVPLSATKH